MKLITKYLVSTNQAAIVQQYQKQFAFIFDQFANKTAIGAQE